MQINKALLALAMGLALAHVQKEPELSVEDESPEPTKDESDEA